MARTTAGGTRSARAYEVSMTEQPCFERATLSVAARWVGMEVREASRHKCGLGQGRFLRDCGGVMRVFDRKCNGCGATYSVAVSDTLPGKPGQFTCVVCGDEVERWEEPSVRVCRLLIASERSAFRIPPTVRELP